jgi:toxin ParE1/3/4
MSNYQISEAALSDIRRIWDYTLETWSDEQAERYYNLLLDEIEYIADNFESGKNMDHIKIGYRSSKVKSHLIFYKRVDDQVIEIVRILHQMMDIENRLK